MTIARLLAVAALALLAFTCAPVHAAERVHAAQPLAIGDTFTLASKALGETRRINVWRPGADAAKPDAPLPVLYLLDGGIGEDFLHVAGLMQVSIANGTMRPFMLVGIENTQRRRDMTPATDVAEDRAIAPVVGGAMPFRAFLRDELMPEIARRYRVDGESALVGESLAGLFVLDTLVTEPALFDDWIAIDPALWWNDQALLKGLRTFLKAHPDLHGRLFIAASSEPTIASLTVWLPSILHDDAPKTLAWRYLPLPDETHGSVFHPAALQLFRALSEPLPRPTAP
jgi:predicted alpha/beta superfamily hydrolase